jgi:hypothetical protein
MKPGRQPLLVNAVQNGFNHRRMTQRRAVTLIEAIAVVLLLSAAAATSMVYLDADFLSRRTASAATIQVGEVLVLARNTAISNQTQCRVRRDTGGLTIAQDAGPLQSQRTWEIELPAGTRINGTARQIVFQPTGSANRDIRWVVQHGDSEGTVTVSPINGNVVWSKP